MGFSIASSSLVMRTAIADIAHFGWVWRHEAVGATLDKFSSVARWYAEISTRPAIAAAITKTMALAQ
jgi:GSH-dependent disulfide-bond oxidoreductase